MPGRLSQDTRRRIGAVAIGEARGAAETSRRLARGMDGGPPVDVPADTVRRIVRQIREAGEADVRPPALAGRMLRIVERELAALERRTGPTDLDRLDKLAATLRRLEPLRPSSSEKPGLQALVTEGADTEPSDQTEGLKALAS